MAISLGHHPIFLIVAAMGIPYNIWNSNIWVPLREKVCGDPRRNTGLPIPAASEIALEGFCSFDDFRDEGPSANTLDTTLRGEAKNRSSLFEPFTIEMIRSISAPHRDARRTIIPTSTR